MWALIRFLPDQTRHLKILKHLSEQKLEWAAHRAPWKQMWILLDCNLNFETTQDWQISIASSAAYYRQSTHFCTQPLLEAFDLRHIKYCNEKQGSWRTATTCWSYNRCSLSFLTQRIFKDVHFNLMVNSSIFSEFLFIRVKAVTS